MRLKKSLFIFIMWIIAIIIGMTFVFQNDPLYGLIWTFFSFLMTISYGIKVFKLKENTTKLEFSKKRKYLEQVSNDIKDYK